METEIKVITMEESGSLNLTEKDNINTSHEKNTSKILSKNALRLRYAISTRSNFMKDSSKRIRRAINMKHLTRLWKCPKCPLSFSSSRTLSYHQKDAQHVVLTKGKSKCPICSRRFSTAEKRKIHLKTHMNLHKTYIDYLLASTICPYCNKCYSSRSGRNKHVRTAHPEQPAVNDVSGLTNIKYLKSKCNVIRQSQPSSKIFVMEEDWELHSSDADVRLVSVKNTHPSGVKKTATNVKPLHCYVCSSSFLRYSNLTRHLRIYHGNLLNFQCSICGARFFSQEHAKPHLTNIHKSKGFIIDLKQKNGKAQVLNTLSACNEGNMLNEMQNGSSSVITPSPSLHMSFASSIKNISGQQELSVNSETQTVEQKVYNSKSLSRMYSCSVCSIYNFLTHGALKKHKRTRLHRRAYQMSLAKTKQIVPQPRQIIVCSVCNISFGEEKEFVLHRMRHFVSEENVLHSVESEANYPYQCEMCGVTVTGIRKIQFHLLWHTYTAKNRNKNSTYSSLHLKKNLDTCRLFKNSVMEPHRFICFGCGNVFTDRIDFIEHKQLMASQNSFHCIADKTATCIKYCVIHESELCCHTNSNTNNKFSGENNEKCGTILTLDIPPIVEITVNTNLRNISVHNNYGEQIKNSVCSIRSDRLNTTTTTTVPNIVLAYDSERKVHNISEGEDPHKMNSSIDLDFVQKQLTCSLCGKINNTLPEFKNHSCFSNGKFNNSYSLISYNNNIESGTSVDSSCGTISICSDSQDSEDDLVKFGSPVNDAVIKSYSLLINDMNPDIKVLRENFSSLLYMLVNDDLLMEKIGWGKKPIDVILEDILSCFGKQSLLDGNGVTVLDKLRHNIKALLKLCVKDTFVKNINVLSSVDETVSDMLKYFRICSTPLT